MAQADHLPADIAFIGFGEAAEAFATGWGADRAARTRAWDVKCTDPEAVALPKARAMRAGVRLAASRETALAGADAVFCLVTADRATEAAAQSAGNLTRGALWFDGNSCSPGAKRQAADLIHAAGGRYVDVAIMAPVHPKPHKTPLLVAGPHAAAAAEVLSALGMEASVAGDTVGAASAIKMIRSVMVKGMEALTAECLLAARRAGVEDRLFSSLADSVPGIAWESQAAYNLERMMVHGRRRAAEMREVAATLAELALPAVLALATADWQQRIGNLDLPAGDAAFPHRADAILKRL